jgi:hypothetical protein
MAHLNRNFSLLLCLFLVAIICMMCPPSVEGWGDHGHSIAGRAAALKLPTAMPKFFRKAVDQLTYLNPEPDRWRDRAESNLDPAMSTSAFPDHFVNIELLPEAAFAAPDRYSFAEEMTKTGRRAAEAGFVQYRILELFQRLRVEFRLWRAEQDKARRQWIEQRIINDAGILGHYVTDGANPHHTTIHHNGWVGDNPKGYTTYSREHGFHFRFENEYVRTHLQLNDLLPLIGSARVIEKPREEIWAFLRSSHAKVEELYALDKREPFGETTTSPDHKRFAASRLAAGAGMLRDLWWTAWATSAPTAAREPVTSYR